MQLMDAIRTRRSIRDYLNRPVEEVKLQRILDAGRLAPSDRNGATLWCAIRRRSKN